MRLQSFGGIAGERVLLFALSVLCSPLAEAAQSKSVATSKLTRNGTRDNQSCEGPRGRCSQQPT